MKPEREELRQPDVPSRVYTSDTEQALIAEVRRGADPYKLARYFDVPITTVLRIQRRTRIIAEILAYKEKNGNQDTEENR